MQPTYQHINLYSLAEFCTNSKTMPKRGGMHFLLLITHFLHISDKCADTKFISGRKQKYSKQLDDLSPVTSDSDESKEVTHNEDPSNASKKKDPKMHKSKSKKRKFNAETQYTGFYCCFRFFSYFYYRVLCTELQLDLSLNQICTLDDFIVFDEKCCNCSFQNSNKC
jgi:hypothetical protein